MSGPHEYTQEVRDPIYGFVKLSKAEWEVVNCPEFQRLRDIRQLAMGHMVYPGAVHTRFEHSIGCLHLSTLMYDALTTGDTSKEILKTEFSIPEDALERQKRVLRLAALLHDIGHAPFSHSGEGLLPSDSATGKKISHESMSAKLILNSSVSEVIKKRYGSEQITCDEIAAVATNFSNTPGFKPQSHHQFLHELLTGEVGSDRIDYLLRDAYHSGQRSGEFDYRRLVSSLILVPPPAEEESGHKIGFDSGGWLVAEQMVVARYLMYQSLYFHKTKRIYEKHLEEFMKTWLVDHGHNGALPEDLKKYIAISDSDIMAGIHKAADDPSHKGHVHAVKFNTRKHLRLAWEIILADNLDPNTPQDRQPCKDRFTDLKNYVSNVFVSKGDLIFDSPDHSAFKFIGVSDKILVLLDDRPRYLDDISEIVRGMSSHIWRGRIYCDPSLRDQVKNTCRKWLTDNPVDKYKKDGEKNAI